MIDACPDLVKKFPKNNFSLMTVSGAKGSRVNFSMISCLLGQQELEGTPWTQASDRSICLEIHTASQGDHLSHVHHLTRMLTNRSSCAYHGHRQVPSLLSAVRSLVESWVRTLGCSNDSLLCHSGFVGDRFLTGIRPQEYYFHCTIALFLTRST